MANLPPVLPQLTYSQLLQNIINAYAAGTGTSPQVTTGDPMLALFQGVSSQLVFIEAVIQQLANVARAQTSTGGDLDTWMAQFNFPRLPATYAEGPVTLSVLSAHNTSVSVPVGTVVQTLGGAIQYQLVADTTQAAYVASSNSYVLAAGQLSITATAQALQPGSGSNVQIGQLNSFAAQPGGIDQVTNTAAISNGVDPETDNAFRARFVLYLQGLGKATATAVGAAIESVQSGLTYTILNNTNNALGYQEGQFLVVVNDGTGHPSSTLLSAVSAAIAPVAPITVQWNVIGPTAVAGTVSLAVSLVSGHTIAQVAPFVQTAVSAYTQGVALGGTVLVSGVVQAALSVAGVASVQSGVTINGAAADFVMTGVEVFVCPATSVTVTQYTP